MSLYRTESSPVLGTHDHSTDATTNVNRDDAFHKSIPGNRSATLGFSHGYFWLLPLLCGAIFAPFSAVVHWRLEAAVVKEYEGFHPWITALHLGYLDSL